RLVSESYLFTGALAQHALHRLAERNPLSRMSLLAHQIVSLCAHAHRQNVIGKPRSLAPYGSQRGMELDLRFVSQNFDPRHAVRVCPHGIVDAREVSCDAAATFFQEV